MPLSPFELVAQTNHGEAKCYSRRSSGVVARRYLIVPSRLRQIHFGSKGAPQASSSHPHRSFSNSPVRKVYEYLHR